MTQQQHGVKDLNLAAEEVFRIESALQELPAVRGLLQWCE